jgi:polar amino acid transport system substrate-binding protein
MEQLRGRAGQVACAIARLALLGLCCSAGAQSLTLHYQERAPYSSTQADGGVSGLTATPAARALQRAGVPFVWARTPGQQQLALIQEGEGPHCGLGWFRNAERAAMGKVSRPLCRDRPFVALARDDSRVRSGMRSEDAMAAPGETLLVKEGWSYGPQLDPLIAQRVVPPVKTSVETTQMVCMLLAGRGTWMIAGAEEAQLLRLQAGVAGAALRTAGLVDLTNGESRHLYCNRAVPDAWLARIDQALAGPTR